jgi:translation elongation factor EF-Ts
VVQNEDNDSEIELSFVRMGAGANHKHLIQDKDFQKQWQEREDELLITQEKCYLCDKKISTTAKPNLYHYNLFKKKTQILEKAEKVPQKVVEGKLTLEEGWKEFNNVLDEVNKYYLSLKDTALVCHQCAKRKGIRE